MSNLTKSKLIKTLKINALKDVETTVSVNIHSYGQTETKELSFSVYDIDKPEKTWYSLSEKGIFGRYMNVDKITENYIYLYTIDMLGQKNTNKIKLTDLTIN